MAEPVKTVDLQIRGVRLLPRNKITVLPANSWQSSKYWMYFPEYQVEILFCDDG